jgi:hypothetical protein
MVLRVISVNRLVAAVLGVLCIFASLPVLAQWGSGPYPMHRFHDYPFVKKAPKTPLSSRGKGERCRLNS